MRLLLPYHAAALYALLERNRAHVREWMPWVDATQSVADMRKFITNGLYRLAENGSFETGIWYRGEIAGVIGLHAIHWPNCSTAFGYWLGEEFQGHGLVTQACGVLMHHVFNTLALNRLEIRAGTANRRSRAVAERLGFAFEGTAHQAEWLYDHFVDHAVYAMTRETWTARKEG